MNFEDWKERHQKTAADPELRVIAFLPELMNATKELLRLIFTESLDKALVNLQEHQNLNSNGISRYARLIGHLKNRILLPQPLDQTDPRVPPKVLTSSIAGFFSEALEIDVSFVQDSLDILKFYVGL